MSNKILIIVESPAKCKKIESFLGSNYKCIASYGHIRELVTKKGLKCIDIEDNYNPIYQNVYKQKKNIEQLKKCVREANEVLLATDDDREGEAIAWHICQVCKLDPKNTKRIIFHEITKTALQKAVSKPCRINMNMVYSQKARQVLDLLVGFTISPILWRNISSNKKSALSAGRCQTPALRLVYDNQIDIDNNPGKKCYSITGYFTNKNIPYSLNTTIDNQEECETFLEDTVNHEHMMSNSIPKHIEKQPPKPLTTSDLQQKASSLLRYSPKKTMKICQTLYENGYITYMRTDSRYYSHEFIESVDTFIQKKYEKKYVGNQLYSLSLNSKNKKTSKDDDKYNDEHNDKQNKNSKKSKKSTKNNTTMNAQEAHEAIRPTDIQRIDIQENSKIKKEEIRMYKLIWNITLESCMANSTYSKFLSTITSPIDALYTYSCEQIQFPGWEIVQGYEEHNKEYHYLLKVNTDKTILYNKIKALYNLRDTKTHYNEAKIISLLEKKGIGRPSTFSSIISKLEERGYVKKENVKGKKINCIDYELVDDEIIEVDNTRIIGEEKHKMVLQPIGKIVIEFLINHYNRIFQYDYTKDMEEELDKIADGNKLWYTLCDVCYKDIIKINKDIKSIEQKKETQLDDDYIFRIARYGPVLMKKVNGKIKYFKIKSDIDIDELKLGNIKPKEAILVEKINNSLGLFKDKDVILKKGKYGLYVQYNERNISLKGLHKNEEDICLNDIIPYIDESNNDVSNSNTLNRGIVRIINDFASIRKGKFGDYIFYKTTDMSKPKFISLKKSNIDYKNCDISILEEYIHNYI